MGHYVGFVVKGQKSSMVILFAGFLSFATFTWMTPILWSLFRKRLDLTSLTLSRYDASDISTERSKNKLIFVVYMLKES
uniref:Uncharacterized protein n=1 Tax=Periophthalmus magnuspinnatus TaxID=409849 RepID=A0A3B4BKC2_9GOBI